MGRDHTLFALEPGYVKMYKEPRQAKHKAGSNNVLQAPSFRNISLKNPATGQSVLLGPTSSSNSNSSASASSSFSTSSNTTTSTNEEAEVVQEVMGTKDLIKRKERRYIGITLERDEQLPRNLRDQGRSRRLGLVQLQ